MDLNSDLGEGAGSDAELLQIVTSANIACGAHAGSAATMRQTVQLARDAGVAIGAHPGYPDRAGFGRRETGASPGDIQRWTREQLEELLDICRAEDARLRYVKPHGALYNRAVRDREAAAAIIAAVVVVDTELALLALPDSAMLEAAHESGLRPVREAFLDRGYLADGSLAPRDRPGGVIADPDLAAQRAVAFARGQPIAGVDGHPLLITAESLCVHGDSVAALAMARAARAALERAGVTLASFAP